MSNRPAAAPALPARPAAPAPEREAAARPPISGACPTAASRTQEDIVVDQTCSPAEQAAAISAIKNGASVNAVASMLGTTPGSVEWLLKKNGLKRNDHKKPAPDEVGDSIAAPAAQAYRKADLAFQQAMHRAIKA